MNNYLAIGLGLALTGSIAWALCSRPSSLGIFGIAMAAMTLAGVGFFVIGAVELDKRSQIKALTGHADYELRRDDQGQEVWTRKATTKPKRWNEE